MDILIEWLVRLLVWLSRWARSLSRLGIVRYEQWQPGQKLKILLVGYNGARNTGADARVVAMVKQLQQRFGSQEAELTLMTLNPDNIKGYFPDNVRILPFPTFFCWSLFRAASAHHAAVLCEGSTLTHTFADALSMFFCQAAGIMKRQGKPCIAYGSDVTPLHRRLRRLAQATCSDVRFIARSQQSLQTLQSLGFQSQIGTDTAWTFRVPARLDTGREHLLAQGWDGRKPLLGVAVINPYCWPVRPSLWRWLMSMLTGRRALQYDKMYFFRDSRKRRDKYRCYLAQMAEAVRAYRDASDAFVVIIGMEKLDARACQDFRAMLGGRCALVTSADTPVFQMTSVLHCLNLLVTSRYHAAVLSMLKGMPIVAVSMDNRLDSLFLDMQLSDRYLHHVGDPDLAGRITRSIAEGEKEREAILQTQREHVRKSQAMLTEMEETLGRHLHGTP